ncbi:TPA: helix-turn-helix domain-containing protein, partial [Escherichia coli]|nr:helix-turn-helix domain-containing protein [Escherichia coli]
LSPVLDKLLDKTLDNNIIKETELDDGINEDDFLSVNELNNFLSVNESDFDSEATKETSKASDLEEDKNSDVINISDSDSDQQDAPCRPESTEDELPDVDLDDEEDPEEELKREQYKAEKKKRFELAKQKNKLSELDDFDDSDDDFTFTPRKKTHIEPKREKVKVRRVYAGGMF